MARRRNRRRRVNRAPRNRTRLSRYLPQVDELSTRGTVLVNSAIDFTLASIGWGSLFVKPLNITIYISTTTIAGVQLIYYTGSKPNNIIGQTFRTIANGSASFRFRFPPWSPIVGGNSGSSQTLVEVQHLQVDTAATPDTESKIYYTIHFWSRRAADPMAISGISLPNRPLGFEMVD